ncbi:hypothetical protein PYW07_013035 [Mythimna separata]|uniref:UDP-glucuronosyltransferase n=1 Tax=Mythimna separata TaxID=271217 RepID=A0AAD7Y5J5_MYTSE|nr:hypothetical protein PYW07_013035 [Mythimna separata]
MQAALAVLLLFVSSSVAYRILCIFPAPTKSHDHLSNGVVQALLNAGHEVTWATPYQKKNFHANLTFVDLAATRAVVDAVDMMDPANAGMSFIRTFARNVSRTAAESPELRKVLVEQQFDAVISTWFINEFEAGYAAIQQAPWILLSSIGVHPSLEALVDEVRSVATVPLHFNDSPIPMGWGRRMLNGLFYLLMTVDGWFDAPRQAAIYEDIFAPLAAERGVPLPPFHEAQHNVSILLVNSHESIAPALSLPPNVVNIAGYHIDEKPPPLPKDLQDLLDGSPQGVIYFSMGSVLKSSALKPHTRYALLKLFSKLPYTVLWKFEEPLPGQPRNVHVRPWLPQPSVLAHKNVKIFITHGGLLSTLEAIHAGVPLLAVPVFGDQPGNAERARRAGYAMRVDFHPDVAEELGVTLKEMMRNDSYYKKAQYLSKIFRARVAPPSELISFYVNLAIETKGAYHLRSQSLKYSWYERWMLDVVLALLAVLAVVIALMTLAVKCCVRRIIGKKKEDLKKKMN